MTRYEELLDELLKECDDPKDLLGKDGLLKQLTKDLVERMLQAEMTNHLGYEKHATEGRNSGNSRNGTGGKTLKTEQGKISIEVPRDRNGDFEPQVIGKGETRFSGFDDKSIWKTCMASMCRPVSSPMSPMRSWMR